MMIAHFIQQFQTIYQKEPWFGDSFQEKLTDVTEEQAFKRPAVEIHAIAEILSHCTYWRTPLIKRLQGDLAYKPSMKSEENWLPLEKLKAKGWKKILMEFDESQKAVVSLLEKAPAEFLNEPYRDHHKMDHLVEGILQHDIYHLGQIGIVKKMVS